MTTVVRGTGVIGTRRTRDEQQYYYWILFAVVGPIVWVGIWVSSYYLGKKYEYIRSKARGANRAVVLARDNQWTLYGKLLTVLRDGGDGPLPMRKFAVALKGEYKAAEVYRGLSILKRSGLVDYEGQMGAETVVAPIDLPLDS